MLLALIVDRQQVFVESYKGESRTGAVVSPTEVFICFGCYVIGRELLTDPRPSQQALSHPLIIEFLIWYGMDTLLRSGIVLLRSQLTQICCIGPASATV